MKKLLLLCSIILLSAACSKSHPDITAIRYDFTSDVSAKYRLDYATSKNSVAATILNGTMWSQTITVSTDSLINFLAVAQLKVYPPSTWASTINSAHVNLKISVKGEEKVSKDTVMNASDSSGISVSYAF